MPEAVDSAADATGTLIGGRYRVVDLLGRGGMASVYRAEDESLGRMVAVKIFAAGGSEADSLKREASEIRLLASMNHHALVTLFDASVDSTDGRDRAFLVMELVDGPTLQSRLAHGPIGPSEVALMAVDLAEALHVVHDRGVVHRDIKPGNILLAPALSTERQFRAKLADFGIAYLMDSTRLTTPGTLIGTAAYLSPEQAEGSAPSPASDTYSLGLVLLEALTGVRAFPGSLVESLSARLMRPPEIPGSLGYEWKSLLTRMTVKDPLQRPSALDVADEARAIHRGADEPQPAASTVTMTLAEELAPTRVMNAATRTEVIGRAPSAAPVATPTAPTPPAVPAEPVAGRRGRTRLWAILAVLLVAAVVVAALVFARPPGPTPPSLPPVGDPLGTHLEQLLESVTP